MNPTYATKIQEWVKYDNQLLRFKEETSSITEKKKALESEIIDYISKNNMNNLTINISDGAIKFSSVNSKPPMSRKSLKTALENYSTNIKPLYDIDEIVEFVYNQLEVTTKTFIKRDIKNA
jgi:hypothetical protein